MIPSERRLRVLWPGGVFLLSLLIGWPASPAHAAPQICDGSGAPTVPAARFKDNGDGTVTDVESNLMWMRCSSGQQWQGARCAGPTAVLSWSEAQRQAERINRDGSAFFSDWRLPALPELATITDRRCSNPRTNLTVFPDTPAASYWTATARAGESGGARRWALNFGNGGVQLVPEDQRLHLRLVRKAP